MRKLLIVALLLAFASNVEAARRWFVQTSDNKIISFTDDDNAPTPAGTIAVADAVIRTEDPPGATGEITPLGTWDGMTYTPPSGGGIVEHFDPTTDSGAVKSSCDAMLDVFDAALAFIQENRAVWPDAARSIAIDGIHWQIINSARVALNSTQHSSQTPEVLRGIGKLAGRKRMAHVGELPRCNRSRTGYPDYPDKGLELGEDLKMIPMRGSRWATARNAIRERHQCRERTKQR